MKILPMKNFQKLTKILKSDDLDVRCYILCNLPNFPLKTSTMAKQYDIAFHYNEDMMKKLCSFIDLPSCKGQNSPIEVHFQDGKLIGATMYEEDARNLHFCYQIDNNSGCAVIYPDQLHELIPPVEKYLEEFIEKNRQAISE
jgi:hypothetical protein